MAKIEDRAAAAAALNDDIGEEKRLEFIQPRGFHVLCDLLMRGCGCAGTRAVFEREVRGVTDLPHQIHRVLKILIRFAGESDDEIR